jgi:hypothetical protein
VLYWIPWLQRLRHDLGLAPDQLIPIGRGGSALWYDTPKAVELYALRSLEDVRIHNWIQQHKTGYHKQYRVTDFERGVIRDAAEAAGLSSYLTVHPAWMYQTLTPFWANAQGLGWLQTKLAWGPAKAPRLEGLQLPEKFVAVRFYFRPTFPASATTVSFCRATIEKIAKTHPVVVLTSGVHADDHADYVPPAMPNVTVLSDVVPMTAQNNLAIQSAVLAKASACVGTYGGLTQFAAKLGIPTIAYYDQWHSVAVAHKHVSDALALQMGVPFQVLKIGELPMLQAFAPVAALST